MGGTRTVRLFLNPRERRKPIENINIMGRTPRNYLFRNAAAA